MLKPLTFDLFWAMKLARAFPPLAVTVTDFCLIYDSNGCSVVLVIRYGYLSIYSNCALDSSVVIATPRFYHWC